MCNIHPLCKTFYVTFISSICFLRLLVYAIYFISYFWFFLDVVVNTTNFAKSASLLSKYEQFSYINFIFPVFLLKVFHRIFLSLFISDVFVCIGSSEEHAGLSRALSQLAELEEKMEQLHNDQVWLKLFSLENERFEVVIFKKIKSQKFVFNYLHIFIESFFFSWKHIFSTSSPFSFLVESILHEAIWFSHNVWCYFLSLQSNVDFFLLCETLKEYLGMILSVKVSILPFNF